MGIWMGSLSGESDREMDEMTLTVGVRIDRRILNVGWLMSADRTIRSTWSRQEPGRTDSTVPTDVNSRWELRSLEPPISVRWVLGALLSR